MHTDPSPTSLFALLPVNHGKFPKQEDSYAFEEDSSSESLSPEQHHSDESQGSACPSSEAVGSAPSCSSSPALTSPRQVKDTCLSWQREGKRCLLCWNSIHCCSVFLRVSLWDCFHWTHSRREFNSLHTKQKCMHVDIKINQMQHI